jgi:hypothetical protein
LTHYIIPRVGEIPKGQFFGKMEWTMMAQTLAQMKFAALVKPDLGNPPSETWQERAREFVSCGRQCLWNDAGVRGLAWLRARGLTNDTITDFKLGFNPIEREDDPEMWGLEGKKVWLPRGVVIPCELFGTMWYVRVRWPRSDPRYKFAHVRGGKAAPFGADRLGSEDRLLLICKGEFDVMLALQEAGDLLDAITLEGAGRRIAQMRRVVQVRFPDGGDLTDYHLASGDLRDLLARAVRFEQPATRQAEPVF